MNKKILLLFSVLCVLQCNGYCLTKEECLNTLQLLHAGHDYEYEFDWTDKPDPNVNSNSDTKNFSLTNASCTDTATLNIDKAYNVTASWSISGTLEVGLKAELRAAIIAAAKIGGRVSGTGTTGETVSYSLTISASTPVSPRIEKHCSWSIITTDATCTYKKSDLHFQCKDCNTPPFDFDLREASGAASGNEGDENIHIWDVPLEPCD